MTSRNRPNRASELTFDNAWLVRSEHTEICSADGVSSHRLYDPVTRTWWLTRSAFLTAIGGCEQLHNEARLAPRMQAAWAAVPMATIWTADRMVVVFEAEESTIVGTAFTGNAISVALFLDLAIGAARAIAQSHAQGILHGDIRPHNLLIDGSGNLRLTGFGYATILDPQKPRMPQPGQAALPYLSPELARHDQAHANVKADLYSLGITFYQMLTGALPFTADSPAAWQHAHVAIEPIPPQLRRTEVPELLGQLVLKLMAKDPKDRYARAASVLADLLHSRSEWTERRHIAPFELDGAGSPSTLIMSGRLVGRAKELDMLTAALSRVRERGESELVLIAGGAGTGKSALVEWLSRETGLESTRFAVGKSDQLQLDIPYAPVAQVIRSLTMALLGEDEPSLALVRDRWLSGLAGQGKAVAELVPEVEHVLGRTAPLSNVPAQQAQTRHENAILRTFAAFAANGFPLVLFIDDLQWADVSTIALLKAFTAQRPGNILLIGAYRDHGHDMEQRFSWLLHADRSSALPVTRIHVKPLTAQELTELVAAALDKPASSVDALARAVHVKTGGNPFFSYQMLRALVDDGVLAYNGECASWEWSEADVAHRRYTDNVIDLMIRRFARLPKSGTELLRHLACVGIRCDEGLLARVAGINPLELTQRLRPFVDAGLLVREPDGYAFQHDRVLESAYSMIEPQARPATHARIASIMIEFWHEQLTEYVFEICNQIERAANHALSERERAAFVHALIVATKRAKSTAAIAQATSYIDEAFRLMPPSWWSSHYALAYAASLLRCECLLAQADLENASREIDALLIRDMPALEKAAVHRLKASLQTVRSDYEGAIDAALSGLALLNVHLERGPTNARMREGYDAVSAALGTRSIASLGKLPATDDRRIQTVMGLLSTLTSSFFVRDGISFLHVAKMVELTLEHGVTPESPYGLSWFGVFIASRYEEYEDGFAYGLAAIALIDHHGYEAERIATLVAIDQVSPWTKPLAYALGHVQNAVTLGLASGDIGMACYACNHIASDLLAMGEHLQLVAEEIERGLEITRLIQYQDIELILYSQNHFLHRLRTGDDVVPRGETTCQSASSAAQRLSQSNSLPTKFWIWLYDGMASVFRQEWDASVRSLTHAEELTWSVPAHINVADCHLFLALALAHAAATPSGQDHVVAALVDHRARFELWAALNPLTFQNKLLLVEAELFRLRGNALQALVCYEQSANAAAAAGFVHEQALAHEFAGMLCEANGLHTSGKQHLRAARACYRRWGADHKATLLTMKYSALDEMGMGESIASKTDRERIAVGRELGVKAAQAMSREVVMDRLIETLMTDIIIHAGAQNGLLLLMRDKRPMIEASGRVVDGRVAVTLETAMPAEQALPLAVLNSVLRTQQTLVLADAMVDAPSIRAKSTSAERLRSVLCLPLVRGGILIGIVYLENNLAPGVFDTNRIEELEVLAPQVAISLETARLYEQLIDENNRRLTAEMNLQGARTELARTSSLTVMGSLAASIAHEVNQPLTAIVASVDASLRWLNRPIPNIPEALDGLSHVKQSSLRAAEIIRALRVLAKQAPAVLAPLQPDDVLREVLSMVRIEIDEQKVKVVTRLAAGSAVTEADRVQLQQVVLNLITNALDAMAETPGDLRELIVTSSREQDEIVVSVQDHGSGIPDDVLTHVFDPFFTTKENGMGMGLAICRSIIEAHGGSLAARARSEGGSEFVFRLPVCGASSHVTHH
jgi:predicted ATPase/signal transduction histidine kinase